jgi:hypothetical protein
MAFYLKYGILKSRKKKEEDRGSPGMRTKEDQGYQEGRNCHGGKNIT